MAHGETPSFRPSFFRTLFLAALAAVLLVAIDSVLANTERRETAAEAAHFYSSGERFMKEGKYSEAADAFQSAIANARDNGEYPLARGEALLDAGDLDAASSTLDDLLKSDSMAGAPNLAMARVFAREGQFDEAVFYYHRSIYGQWKQDAAANRVKVRFELANLLARRNLQPELLADLLPLQDEAPHDAATQNRLARLYLTAGSPGRAAAIFRNLIKASPQDPDAHEGLGEADFSLGDYQAAQTDLTAALKLRPGDQTAGRALALCDQVLNLDPLRRGIGGQERYQRSVNVLQMVVDKTTQCMTPAHAQVAVDLISAAHAALTKRVPAAGQSEAVETNLDLANKLWQAGKEDCRPGASGADDPLQLVLAKAAK